MAFWNDKKGFFKDIVEPIDESIKAFRNKSEGERISVSDMNSQRGEGWETVIDMPGVGNVGLSSFNMFYNNYINIQHNSEVNKIKYYRSMSAYPEIADVIEDAANESTQENSNGKIFNLEIIDSELSGNKNIVDNINKEFENLFTERIGINEVMWDLFRTYMVDGRLFYERIIDEKKQNQGILNIKKLPAETMDYIYDPSNGTILNYFQYLATNITKPKSKTEAEKDKRIVIFEPSQIGFINYGLYGINKYDIYGFLEKVKIPYNQLKLLETSVIIYRIVRAPERLVFRIDTGNMPRDKALKYVEKIKQKMTKKQTYNPTNGTLDQAPEIMSILENYYIPQSADGRGSQIESVGGGSAGFTELDDIYYFARKMYRSLKYPLSRITAEQEKQDNMFGGSSTGEITRDEVKWSKFLERQQNKFCKEFTDLFLLHLEFKGIKQQYELTNKKIRIYMNPPSNYKEQMEHNFIESRFSNYTMLADREEFSKYWLMKKYLKFNDDEIKSNYESMKKDLEFGFKKEEDEGY